MATKAAISIEGTLLMLDDETPHVAVPVQVMQDGEVIATTLSDERGRYQFVDLKPGSYQLRCQVLGGCVYYGEERRGKGDRGKRGQGEKGKRGRGERGDGDILRVESGKTLKGIDLRFAPFKKGRWRNYSYLDGLTRDWIFSIYCDSEGIMWFGSEIGAFRYDGKEFIHFTQKDGLPYGHLFPIVRGPDAMMWFGIIEGGVSRYDGKEFVTLTTEDGLAYNSVYSIHCDPDGVLWFGTVGGGVSRYDGKEFVNFTTEDGLVNNYVTAIYRDPDGVMWFATRGGVSRYDGKEFVNFTTGDGLAHNFVQDIHRDRDGVMWFATFGGWDHEEGGGLSRYDGNGFINLTTKDGLAHNSVFTIHCDPDGVMWFGTYGGGVSRYDGETFVNFTTEDGLADNHVYSIYCDPDGVMWFATNRGVSRYDPNRFVNFTTEDGLVGNNVRTTHSTPDGVVWFGTGGWFRTGAGVSRYDGKEFVSFTTEDGLANNHVWAIYSDPDGIMWFGTDGGGVSRYDGSEFVNFTTENGLVHNHVSAIHRDPDGVMWFGTYGGGVSRYDGKEFVNLATEDGLVDEYVNAIYRDPDGVMWFGTGWSRSRGGVSRYGGNTFINYTTEDGLAGDAVFAIHRDPDGVMWFGTTGGLSLYDGKEFVNFTREDGLAHDNVNTIYRGPDGVMWFGTDGGVSAYDGIAWASLDIRDGLSGRYVGSILQDPDGSLWFGTEGGVTRYRRSTTPPRAYIVSVTTDQTYHDISDIPVFTPGTRVTIEYDSIDLKTLPEKRQYRCRIYETSDSSLKSQVSSLPYNPPTKETSFDWIPEEPGTYIFQVQAIDRDLNYSEPATVSFTIEPDPALVSMQAELNYLRSEVGWKYQFGSIIGRSAAIMQVRGLMEKAIESRLAVLITGETGTGKELVAKAIHHNSPRRDRPLLALNCGAIPKELLASELFGHRRGAFTGAREDKIGLFEAASGGTVILDEISEMPEDAQVYLLRVLEERMVQRLGEHISRDVDVRVIAIANKDLMKEVSEGRFREDLYYRLSVFPIHIPPLRERIEDIFLLAEHFLRDIEKELDGFAPDVFQMLQSYPWPGNVRELRNAVHRAAALAEEKIQTYHFPPEITRGESLIQDAIASQSSYSETVESFQRRFIEQVLRECDGNRHEAARRLKMNRSNLLRLIKRFGIS